MKKSMIFLLVIFFVPFLSMAGPNFQLEVAKFWLKEIRENPGNYQAGLWNLKESEKAGITLEQVGTNERELKLLKEKGCLRNVSARVKALYKKQTAEDENTCFLLLMEELEECRLHLDQVLRSFQEFERFKERIKARKLIEKNAENPKQAKDWKGWLLIFD